MRAYAGLGACTRQIGELRSSLNYYQQYLSIALKIPDKKAASKAYCCIGEWLLSHRSVVTVAHVSGYCC